MKVLIKLSDAIKTLKSMAVPLVRKLPSAQPERLTDYSFEESCTECPAYDTENHRCPRFNQVIRTALKDANLEPCENCISRQAAIDALDEQIALCDKALKSFGISMRDEYAVKVERASLVAFREKLEYLQPAQPEIIRCKDCKHFEYDHPYIIQGIPLLGHEVCNAWGDGCKTDENGYCFMAERRTDDS